MEAKQFTAGSPGIPHVGRVAFAEGTQEQSFGFDDQAFASVFSFCSGSSSGTPRIIRR